MAHEMEFTPETTLIEAANWLFEQLKKDGAICPCCTQLAKVYKRKINSNMARTLILGYQAAGLEWFHAPTVVADRGELAKLRFWGLVEEEKALRPDGGRAGWWHITPKGRDFILGHKELPAHVLIYDGRAIRLDESSGRIGIRQALGDKFSYRELMGQPLPPVEIKAVG